MASERSNFFTINCEGDPRNLGYMPGRVFNGLVMLNGLQLSDNLSQKTVPGANYGAENGIDELKRLYSVGSTVTIRTAYNTAITEVTIQKHTGTAFSAIGSTISATVASVVPYRGTAYIFHDNNSTPTPVPQKKWTGSGAWTSMSAYPSGAGIACAWKDRLWAISNTGTLRWSEFGQPEVWPVYNEMIVPDDGSYRKPMGMVPWGDELVIFFEDCIASVIEAGNQGEYFAQITRYGRGTRSRKGICPTYDLGILFFDYDGIFAYNEGSVSRIAASNIFPYFDVNPSYVGRTSIAYYRKKRQIWVSYVQGSDTSMSAIRVIDLTQGATWQDYQATAGDVKGVGALITYDGAGDACQMYGLSNGVLVPVDTGTNSSPSSNFDFAATWSGQDFEKPGIVKKVLNVRITASGTGTFQFRYRPEHVSASSNDFVAKTCKFRSSSSAFIKKPFYIPLKDMRGESFNYMIYAAATVGLKIYSIVFEYVEEPTEWVSHIDS